MRGQTWRLDDIPVGYVHRFGAAPVLAEDIALFAERFGPGLALRAEEEATGAPQALVFALWSRMVAEETRDWPILARYGQDSLRWYAWARPGDVLCVRLTMTAKQNVSDDRGFLFAQHEVLEQNGELVLSLMTRTLLSRSA